MHVTDSPVQLLERGHSYQMNTVIYEVLIVNLIIVHC